MKTSWRLCGLACIAASISAQAAQVQAAPLLRPKGVLTMRAMKVASTSAEGSKLYFGPGYDYSVGVDASGDFAVRQASKQEPLLLFDALSTMRVGASRVEAKAVDAGGGLSVRGVRQWQLVRSEDFSLATPGWSRAEVSQCGGVFMLGGYCKFSKGEVNKTFSALPPHKQLRVVASYHFIDRWIGETGYMKLNIGENGSPTVVWSEQHSQQMSKNGISLCGQPETPEGKFSASVDVTVPHDEASVELTFGSTMDASDPCDESWGVSGVEIYTRS